MNNCLNNNVRLIASIKKFKSFVEGGFLMKILAFLVAFLFCIAFFLDEKFVHFGYIDVTMEEFEAIQQQLKELGWL